MNARRFVPQIISTLFLILILFAIGWVGFHLTHPVSVATIVCKVSQGPPDDTALKQWLATQPPVIKVAISRADSTLTVKYKLRNAQAMDYAHTIVGQCQQLGYAVNGHSVSSNANPFLGTAFFPDPF